MVGAKCKVSFDVPNSIANVLGFKLSIYGGRRHASEYLVNIMSVNSILVHCNIIHSSYMRGTQAPFANNFFPNAASGKSSLWVNHGKICDFACLLPLKPRTMNLFNRVVHFDDASGFNGYIEIVEIYNYYKSIPPGFVAAL